MRKEMSRIFWFFLLTFYCVTFRLIPFKIPNVEPILPIQIFLNKKFGSFFIFIFGFLNIVIFDLITFKFGIWTIITSLIFGLLSFIFKLFNKKGINNNICLIIFGTLFFDFITSLIGPLMYNQSLSQALIGQIPFTLVHLIGNICFIIILDILGILYKEKVKKLTYFKI